MKSYQIKIILKNSKPPVWKRCVIPAGITFSQLALILEEMVEAEMTADYEYEFYQAGVHVREWKDGERQVTSYRFDYMCASDTYIDSLADKEAWFTFRMGEGCQYRIEIEKRLPEPISYPSVIKQKGCAQIREWTDTDTMNERLRQRYPIHYGEPDYRNFDELRKDPEIKNKGINGAEKPVDRTDRQERSTESKLKDFSEQVIQLYAQQMTEKITSQVKNIKESDDAGVDELRSLLEETEWKMKKEVREKLFGYPGEEESREPDIKEFLLGATREELLEMAEDLELTHYKSLNKTGLAERIRDEILKPEVMAKRLLLLSDAEIQEFEKAASKANGFYPSREEMDNLEKMYDLAYVMLYSDDYAQVPREAAEVYEKINTPEFQEKRQGTFWMYHCLMMVEMIYGCAPVRIVCRMLEKCQGHKVDRGEFEELFVNVPEELNPCVLVEDRVIYKEILKDKLYLKMEQSQEGKDFYIPGPDEIIEYTEKGYPVSDPCYRRLKTFLVRELDSDIAGVEELMPVLWNHISMGARLSDIMDILEDQQIVFKTEDAVEKFVSLMMDVNNNTRMVIHRGRTPNEMQNRRSALPGGKRHTIVPMSSEVAELLGGAADDLKGMGFNVDLDYNADEITAVAMPNGISGKAVTGKKKIYPNDPCPCGSGKKYKKCCGKKK